MKNSCFALYVDDFHVKYTCTNDTKHLITALEDEDIITNDMNAKQYYEVILAWDYKNRYKPGYVGRSLKEFINTRPSRSHMYHNRGQRLYIGVKLNWQI